jgi:hypothetical protein
LWVEQHIARQSFDPPARHRRAAQARRPRHDAAARARCNDCLSASAGGQAFREREWSSRPGCRGGRLAREYPRERDARAGRPEACPTTRRACVKGARCQTTVFCRPSPNSRSRGHVRCGHTTGSTRGSPGPNSTGRLATRPAHRRGAAALHEALRAIDDEPLLRLPEAHLPAMHGALWLGLLAVVQEQG